MRRCYFCGKTQGLERHHIYNGAFRKKSEQYGAVVDLCHACHNEPPDGVHHNAERMLWLKQIFQTKLMLRNEWTLSDFIAMFGKNYSDDE